MAHHWQEWAVYAIVGITALIFLKNILWKKKHRTSSTCGDCNCPKPAEITKRRPRA